MGWTFKNNFVYLISICTGKLVQQWKVKVLFLKYFPIQLKVNSQVN